jgi:Sel1 repeat-containing protein
MKPSPCLTVVLVWCITLSVLVKAHADVDPGMVGTWETSGVNEHGPWKLTWEIHADTSYVLSGALSDSGIIGSGNGRWHTRSNITKQSADGTYNLRDANHMEGTGPTGSGVWTRVGDASASATPAEPSEWNPFANVFQEENSGAPTLTDLSRQLAYDYRNALFKKDEASRNRLEKKAQSGMAEAQVLFGMLLQREKNPAEAVGWYRKAAQQGNIDGMRGLGSCYRDGEGVSDDAVEAMKWYRKASDQGDGDADSNIGGLYHNGRGVAKDDAVAVSWFRKGAAKGSVYAMSDLAACYWTGTGVEKSAREAINWWKQAADKGNEEAKNNLKMALEKFDEFGQPRTRK